MLKEYRARADGCLRRRHYLDDALELFVWLEAAGTIVSFQLCYDRLGRERAITWRVDGGFEHDSLDAGDETPTKNRTPLAHPIADDIPFARLLAEFDGRSGSMDVEIREAVRQRLLAELGSGQ